MKQSKIYFHKNLNDQIDFEKSVLIYDQVLEKEYSTWIRKFKNRISVRSGEKLKDLRHLQSAIDSLNKFSSNISLRQLQIVAMGGGSVGDFAGFVASIYKRGVGLVHIPTTWLSALDSAHGGKTALNVGGVKNQVGTFYPADEIHLFEEIFKDLPIQSIQQVRGELYKTALIAGGPIWKKLLTQTALDFDTLWKMLPALIQIKVRIVKKDPFEKKGIRSILNLGHTIGHIIESACSVHHGEAVLLGLRFAYDFGLRKKITHSISELQWLIPSQDELKVYAKKVKNFEKLLLADKKRTQAKELLFIFIEKPGKVVTRKIPTSQIISEWSRVRGL